MEKNPTLPGALTYHKLNTDVICDIFQAFEADLNPILGVVQIAQMQHDDLVTFLDVENEFILPASHFFNIPLFLITGISEYMCLIVTDV